LIFLPAREFAEGRPIDAPATLGARLAEIGVAAEPPLARGRGRQQGGVEGANGAPRLTTPDSEVFWGDDRLDERRDRARSHDSAARKERT
jgi:hypothetical protein